MSIVYPAPLADQPTLRFAVAFCTRELGMHGIEAIYLIGSRACGTPRTNSDHDLLVVLSDRAPRELGTGGALHTELFEKLCGELRRAALGTVDLITQRATHYSSTRSQAGTFANATMNGGIRLA